MEILQALVDRGAVRIIADQWVENWDPAQARRIAENVIASTKGLFDAVLASNDGTALGALSSLGDAGLAGKVPISGMDATEAACNSIARGELSFTVLKDVRLLSPAVCEIALRLAGGEAVSDLVFVSLSNYFLDIYRLGYMPCKFLPLTLITKDNLKQTIVDSGLLSYEAVYKDVDNPPPR